MSWRPSLIGRSKTTSPRRPRPSTWQSWRWAGSAIRREFPSFDVFSSPPGASIEVTRNGKPPGCWASWSANHSRMRATRSVQLETGSSSMRRRIMHNEFTAIIERDGKWFIAYCPEVPGANGQGRTIDEARTSLAEAIALILEDRREKGLRGVPAGAIQQVVIVE